jgi:hypothetical protein
VRIARAVAVVAVLIVAAVMVVNRPAGADLLCLDKAGNFVACSQPTAPSVPPSSTLPPTTMPSPPPAAKPPSHAPGNALEVALPDLDHSPRHPGGSRPRGLAGPVAIVDGAVFVLLVFAAFERRRAAVNA